MPLQALLFFSLYVTTHAKSHAVLQQYSLPADLQTVSIPGAQVGSRYEPFLHGEWQTTHDLPELFSWAATHAASHDDVQQEGLVAQTVATLALQVGESGSPTVHSAWQTGPPPAPAEPDAPPLPEPPPAPPALGHTQAS